jgi:hypothetical protein
MYDTDHDRMIENYPDRLTHLFDYQYVLDARIFVCPMDPIRRDPAAPRKDENYCGLPSLKPIYRRGERYREASDPAAQIPYDDKADWAERAGIVDEYPTENGEVIRRPERNCSYLYEFSSRECERWEGGAENPTWSNSPSTWCSDFLVSWYNDDRYYNDPYWGEEQWPVADTYGEDGSWDIIYLIVPANPKDVDRNGDGVVTWQEAKFSQLENGDVYNTGNNGPGDRNIPSSWSTDPIDTIPFGENPRQHGYPRNWLPMVRCFYHMTPQSIDYEGFEEVLNLAVEGNTFYSSPGWEPTAWKYGRQRYYLDDY